MHKLYKPAGNGERGFYYDDYDKNLRIVPFDTRPTLVKQQRRLFKAHFP